MHLINYLEDLCLPCGSRSMGTRTYLMSRGQRHLKEDLVSSLIGQGKGQLLHAFFLFKIMSLVLVTTLMRVSM